MFYIPHFVCSPGADASKELQEFAAKTIGAGQYEELAMGGGQQEVAMHMLRSAAQNGSWLCLKNLHLVVAWLPSLEKELSSLEPHQDFRLWLTSETHPGFPSILLQQSLKVGSSSSLVSFRLACFGLADFGLAVFPCSDDYLLSNFNSSLLLSDCSLVLSALYYLVSAFVHLSNASSDFTSSQSLSVSLYPTQCHFLCSNSATLDLFQAIRTQ